MVMFFVGVDAVIGDVLVVGSADGGVNDVVRDVCW